MKIRSNEEVRLFEEAVDRCRHAVLLLLPDGTQYDLKTPFGRYQGIAQLMSAKPFMEPDLYTNCAEDEMIMFEYFRAARAIA